MKNILLCISLGLLLLSCKKADMPNSPIKDGLVLHYDMGDAPNHPIPVTVSFKEIGKDKFEVTEIGSTSNTYEVDRLFRYVDKGKRTGWETMLVQGALFWISPEELQANTNQHCTILQEERKLINKTYYETYKVQIKEYPTNISWHEKHTGLLIANEIQQQPLLKLIRTNADGL